MNEAAGRDMIARQYASDFADVFKIGLAMLDDAAARGETDMWPAIFAYLGFLTAFQTVMSVANTEPEQPLRCSPKREASLPRCTPEERGRSAFDAHGIRPAP
jgi:hypothetical protein